MIKITVNGITASDFADIDIWCFAKFGGKKHFFIQSPPDNNVWTSVYYVNGSAIYSFLHSKDAVLFSLKWATDDTNLHTR